MAPRGLVSASLRPAGAGGAIGGGRHFGRWPCGEAAILKEGFTAMRGLRVGGGAEALSLPSP